MSSTPPRWDVWRGPTLLLWLVFFLVGLVPEAFFFLLREVGEVSERHALVNSPYVISLAFAAFVTVFCLRRCRQAGVSIPDAQDKAVAFAILALIAFLPVDITTVLAAHANPLVQDPWLVYIVCTAKLLAWWYLLSVFIRYYLFGADTAFAEMWSIFPSTWRPFARKSTSVVPPQPDPKDGIPSPHEEKAGE